MSIKKVQKVSKLVILFLDLQAVPQNPKKKTPHISISLWSFYYIDVGGFLLIWPRFKTMPLEENFVSTMDQVR
jgi:hypothetical protein